MKISKSNDNPYKLYCHCPNKNGCGYFKLLVLERDDFKYATIFQGGLAKIVDSELVSVIENEVKDVKAIMETS